MIRSGHFFGITPSGFWGIMVFCCGFYINVSALGIVP
jgi:hypothetical protein